MKNNRMLDEAMPNFSHAKSMILKKAADLPDGHVDGGYCLI